MRLRTGTGGPSPSARNLATVQAWRVTYHQLGRTAQYRGRLDEAEEWYRKSLAIKEELGDRPGMARHLPWLGVTAEDRGRLDEAEDWYRKSLAIREELGDRPGLAAHLPSARYHRPGRVDGWMRLTDWYRKSLAIKEELGNRPGMASTYHQLGMIAEDRGRLDEAEDWYRKSLAIDEELGNQPGMARSYHHLAIIALDPRAAG